MTCDSPERSTWSPPATMKSPPRFGKALPVGKDLQWGLSAAGYLDPEIFRFLPAATGVELMSGFGMTEATGGITMTPPGGYKEDSLGGQPFPASRPRSPTMAELQGAWTHT